MQGRTPYFEQYKENLLAAYILHGLYFKSVWRLGSVSGSKNVVITQNM